MENKQNNIIDKILESYYGLTHAQSDMVWSRGK